MSKSQGLKRYPAIRCWINHVIEGKYLPEERILETVFGKVKRVRMLATILNKKEHIFTDSFDENQNNINLKFTLDDGTGIINAYVKEWDKEQFKNVSKGDLVDIVGIITFKDDFISISPTEIIKRIEKPDLKLLRDAEIIEKLKLDKDMRISIPKKSIRKIELKEQIYGTIEEYSEGISFNDLKVRFNVKDDELRKILKDLEIDLRIYSSEEDVYQCF
jgi:RPA family protein